MRPGDAAAGVARRAPAGVEALVATVALSRSATVVERNRVGTGLATHDARRAVRRASDSSR